MNYYYDLNGSWKTELIARRARRFGFDENDVEDAQQELVLKVLSFKYDPGRSNGASERALLAGYIDNRLLNMRRGEDRRKKREEKAAASKWVEPTSERMLAQDVRRAVDTLPSFEQKLCRVLGTGMTMQEMSAEFQCGRARLVSAMDRIRRHFDKLGLAPDGNSGLKRMEAERKFSWTPLASASA